MMLDQMNKKHEQMLANREMPKKPDGPKTVGAKVDPDLYQQLMLLKERRGLKSIKEALLLAAREGVSRL